MDLICAQLDSNTLSLDMLLKEPKAKVVHTQASLRHSLERSEVAWNATSTIIGVHLVAAHVDIL